jgi:rubrerythrin
MNAFTVAKKLEKDASELYNKLARHTSSSSLKTLISDLAADHRDRYRTLKALTGASACPADASENLHSIADMLLEHLLAAQSDRKPQDLEKSIRTIMELELTTADFYVELQSLASSSPMRSLLQRIIEQEQQDCTMVEEFYEFVNAPNEYLAAAEFSNLDEFHQFGRQIG